VRNEENIDITSIALGWTGSVAKWMRCMGHSHQCSLCNNIQYAYPHARYVEGATLATATTDH